MVTEGLEDAVPDVGELVSAPISVQDGEDVRSYVTTLFTSVPMDRVVECIRRKLEADNTV